MLIRPPIIVLLALCLIAALLAGDRAASADVAPLGLGPPVRYGEPALGGREANGYYQDCLSRRDNGDMACGESCFWRECLTCNNVCTLSCNEPTHCDCHSIPCCPDP